MQAHQTAPSHENNLVNSVNSTASAREKDFNMVCQINSKRKSLTSFKTRSIEVDLDKDTRVARQPLTLIGGKKVRND
jgi:hypothetical protein